MESVRDGTMAQSGHYVRLAAEPPASSENRDLSPMTALVFAFLGGLILNIMPCVLPVLSLKLFGMVKSAGEGRAQLVLGTLATTAGILVSFWALALAAVVAARRAVRHDERVDSEAARSSGRKARQDLRSRYRPVICLPPGVARWKDCW